MVLAARHHPRPDPSPHSDVHAELTFIVPQASKPFFESAALTGTVPRIHFRTEGRMVKVHDMRPLEGQLSLDRQGFVLVRHESAVDDLYDDRAVTSRYNREIERLLTTLTGAVRVVVFDHTRRSSSSGGASNPDGFRGPADRVHVDYTTRSGLQRAADVLGREDVERILANGGHLMQINIWRPIRGPVLRSPLAVADAASVDPRELVTTDQRFPDRVGEIYHLAYGSGQRWYWAPRMEREEVLLLKGWDSRDDGRARFTPHGAFTLDEEDPAAPPRESLESRTFLVFGP